MASTQINWALTPAEARQLQNELAGRVVCEDRIGKIANVAGIDVGFEEGGKVARAAVVVLKFPGLELVETAIARRKTSFPYIPGLLSFREIPVILDALEKLKCRPDLLLCDGQGRAHPRRFGIASHLGVITGMPSIGVAKSRLIGEFGNLPGRKGAHVPLTDDGEVIGTVLRTKTGVKPLFISVGHRLSLETAMEIVLKCTTKYRLLETTRAAHHLASELQIS